MMNFEKYFFDEIQMTNTIMFQTLGLYDQMDSRGMDGVAEEPKRRLWIGNGP